MGSHIFVLQDCILVSQSQAECLKTNVYHADFLVVSELQNELISYYTLSVYHLQLDNICEDCYNRYKEADVHQFCRQNKTSLETSYAQNLRADCFSTSYFQRCLQVRLKTAFYTRPIQIIPTCRPCSLKRIASSTWSRSSAERDSALHRPSRGNATELAIENKDSQSFPGLLCRPGLQH